jgi:hypothetical protein
MRGYWAPKTLPSRIEQLVAPIVDDTTSSRFPVVLEVIMIVSEPCDLPFVTLSVYSP